MSLGSVRDAYAFLDLSMTLYHQEFQELMNLEMIRPEIECGEHRTPYVTRYNNNGYAVLTTCPECYALDFYPNE